MTQNEALAQATLAGVGVACGLSADVPADAVLRAAVAHQRALAGACALLGVSDPAQAHDAIVALGYNPDQERDERGRFGSGGAAAAKGESAARAGGPGAAAAGKASSDAGMLSKEADKNNAATLHRAAEAQHGLAAIMHRDAAAKQTDPTAAAAHRDAADAHDRAAAEHGAAAPKIDQARIDHARDVLAGAKNVSQIGGTFAHGDDAQSRVHWAATKAAETGKPVYVVPMKPGQERHTSEGALKLAYKAPASGEYHVVHPDGRIQHVAGKVKASVGAYDADTIDAAAVLPEHEMLTALSAVR